MPARHAGFAAVTVVSERLINRVLETYVNTFLSGVQVPLSQTVRLTAGVSVDVALDARAVLLSARAALSRNAAGLIPMTFRFYAKARLTAAPSNGGAALASFAPEVMVEADLSAALLPMVQGSQLQFGLNAAGSHLGGIRARILDGDGMPPAYQSEVVKIIQGPVVRAAVQAALNAITPQQLALTPGTIPASYNFKQMKPLQPGEVWVDAHIATDRIVYWPLQGALALACDVAGFTHGVPTDLHDFRNGADLAAATNLDFMQAYFASAVLPQMRNAFLANNLRIDTVDFLRFSHRDFDNGPADYLELGLSASVWTHDFLHFIVAGTTKISSVDVTIPAAPYLYNHKEIRLQFGMIDVDLPDWVDATLFGLSLLLPPVTLFLPTIVDEALHNALVDAASAANGAGSKLGADITQDLKLPGTAGPTYRFTPQSLWMQCQAGERSATMAASLEPVSQPQLTVALADANITVDSHIDRQEIRRDNGLSDSITARLVLPPAFVQRKDPTLRVRFETALNGTVVPSFTRDLRLFGLQVSQVLGQPAPDPLVLVIDTKRMVSPTKTDQEVRISVRLYRSMGGVTDDLYNGTLHVLSVDPRPDDVKPYVQWAHRTAYYNNHRKVLVARRSKIHKVPGKGGCRFSNQYLLPSMRSPFVFVSLRRFTGLPFDLVDIEANRDKVCPYCFFGGPDKHPGTSVTSKVDRTGVIGKLINP
ncbi:MAG: hypothetical protein EOP39_00570 [Rubrivivax sp.]|nr:MAG: hypothetical protein EOP39_00570 [Rubrivivax sp.]